MNVQGKQTVRSRLVAATQHDGDEYVYLVPINQTIDIIAVIGVVSSTDIAGGWFQITIDGILALYQTIGEAFSFINSPILSLAPVRALPGEAISFSTTGTSVTADFSVLVDIHWSELPSLPIP